MEKESNIIANNVLTQIIGRLIVLALSLISIKLVTNYLGPEGTGYYNTVITYLSFFITFADFGLFSVGVREIAKNPARTREILGNIFSIRIISALLAVTIAYLIVAFTNYPPEIKNGVLVAAVFPIFNLAASVYDIYFQYRLEMKKAAIAEVISRIVSVTTIYLAIVFNLGFYYVMASVSISAAINFFIKYLYAARRTKIAFAYQPQISRWILKLSIPLGIVFIVNNFYFKVDTLILFYFKGATDVGIYSVAYKVLETTVFAAAFLAYSLKPLLSVSVEKDKEKASRATTKGLLFLLFMSLCIAIACVPFSKEIIIFFSNSSFLGGAPVLIILSFASIFIYLNILFGEIMIAKDMRKYLIWVSLSVLAFNVATNIIFIPKYSYLAAASTTLASEILLLILGYIFVSRQLPLRLDFFRSAKLLFSALLAIVLALLLKAIGLYFIIGIILSLGFYLFSAYAVDAVPKHLINDYLFSIKNKWTRNSQL